MNNVSIQGHKWSAGIGIAVDCASGASNIVVNSHREKLIIQNAHASHVLYILFENPSNSVATTSVYSVKLAAGEIIHLDSFVGAVSLIGSADVRWTEFG
jgi:hypothetical protein